MISLQPDWRGVGSVLVQPHVGKYVVLFSHYERLGQSALRPIVVLSSVVTDRLLYHLISQAGWNRCSLLIHLSILRASKHYPLERRPVISQGSHDCIQKVVHGSVYVYQVPNNANAATSML